MDPRLAAGLWEIGKLGLQQFLLYARMAGKTSEEIKAEFDASSARFDERPVADLEPPPG